MTIGPSLTWIIQGYETRAFKSNFDSWPSGAVPSTGEEGRGKVAGIFCSVVVKRNDGFAGNCY